MKTMMKSLPTFFALLLLASCSSSDNIFLGKFRQAPTVEVTDIACEQLGLEVPGGAVCYLADTLLVVHTPMNPEWFFSLYSLNDLSPAGQVIRVGNGPGEYPQYMLSKCSSLLTENDGVKMWLANQTTGRIVERIDFTRSLAEGHTVVDSVVDMSHLDEQRGFLQPVGDHLWMNYYIEKGGFGLLLYDSSSDSILCKQNLYREPHSDIGLFSAADCIDDEHTLWAGAMLCFPQINFIPLSDGKLDMKKAFSVSLEKHPVLLSEVADTPPAQSLTRCYSSLIHRADRFVASYGVTAESTELHIFDDRGNLLHRLRLDCRVPYFDIDPSTGMLYGLCSEQLVRADIRQWLNTK